MKPGFGNIGFVGKIFQGIGKFESQISQEMVLARRVMRQGVLQESFALLREARSLRSGIWHVGSVRMGFYGPELTE